jgi:hypothetical protein
MIGRIVGLARELRGERPRNPFPEGPRVHPSPQQEARRGIILVFLGWPCEFGGDCAYPGLGWRCGHRRSR